MARTQQPAKANADPLMEAAVDYFASRSHNAWRRALLKSEPKQRGQPRLRMRGGAMVDVNQPWARLDPKAKADNRIAAHDAFAAIAKFPNDREAAADHVHKCWIKRNRADRNQPRALFDPYSALPEVEKDKDRAHVDRMKAALAAVRKQQRKSPRKRKDVRAAVGDKTLTIKANDWARLEAAAASLSRQLGRDVAPEALARAGIEAVAAVCAAVTPRSKSRKR